MGYKTTKLMPAVRSNFNSSILLSANDGISYGLMRNTDVPDVTRIYLQHFPHYARQWFQDLGRAEIFYEDMFEFVRSVNPDTCFSAWVTDVLIGYLFLVNPERKLIPKIFKERFLFHTVKRLLTNQYGLSMSSLKKIIVKLLFSPQPKVYGYEISRMPYIYVIAIDEAFTNQGVGTRLIELAKSVSIRMDKNIWLEVERENIGAINFYHRHGFNTIASNDNQYVMLWSN